MRCDKTYYVKRVEVEGLWNRFDIVWDINRDVTILSGHNGTGKSTIIRSLAELFRAGKLSAENLSLVKGLTVEFENGDTLTSHHNGRVCPHKVDIISTFDSRFRESETLKSISDGLVRSELDLDIFRIQKRYLSYQLEQSRQIISLLTEKAPTEEIEAAKQHKTIFFDIMDSLFAPTNKTIDRESDELSFNSPSGVISPYMLSSGEKHILIILATVLIQDNAPAILLMDEPEISLHFDWQGRLIDNILALNPNVQVIMSTHSPAIIMKGWIGHVTEIEDLITKEHKG